MKCMFDLQDRIRLICASGLVCAALAGSSRTLAQDTESCYPPSRPEYCGSATQALALCCVDYSACEARIEDLNQRYPQAHFVCAGGSALDCATGETAVCYDF
jgi:hypothetical protein